VWKNERGKGKSNEKEQKKSTECFYCIELKLAGEGRKRNKRRWGGVAPSMRK